MCRVLLASKRSGLGSHIAKAARLRPIRGTAVITSPIAAVIFDLDGTLIDSDRLYLRAYHQASVEIGFSAEASIYPAVRGLSKLERRKILAAYCGSVTRADELERRAGEHFDISANSGIPLCAGAEELLSLLVDLMIPMAVVTSAGRDYADYHLSRSGIRHLFTAVITHDDNFLSKPSAEPFLAAAAALGIEPSQCLVIEDSLPGLVAARAARMNALQVRSTDAGDLIPLGPYAQPSTTLSEIRERISYEYTHPSHTES